MAISERVTNALIDGYELRIKELQKTIDALVAENERLNEHVERLALDLAMTQSDFKGLIK